MAGKTLKIFLVDGVPSGVMVVEIPNQWTGQMIVVPRTRLQDLGKRSEEIQRPGIYILAGTYANGTEIVEKVYIGESEDVLERLNQHNKSEDREFWVRTVIITSKDDNLTKGHIKYLESRLIFIGNESKRAILANGNAPELNNLPESDRSDMEYFLEQIRTLLPVVGLNFAVPLPVVQTTTSVVSNTEEVIFEGRGPGRVTAKAQVIGDEFVVLAGSFARKSDTPSLQLTYRRLREQLRVDGKFVDSSDPELYIFGENVGFNSSTAAATAITGTSTSGTGYWAIDGITYGEWQARQLQSSSDEASKNSFN